MSDLDLEKFKQKVRLGTIVVVGIFGVIFYLLWSILNRLELGDITIQVFILLVLLIFMRLRQQPPVVIPIPTNLFGQKNFEDGMEVG